jgi:hypothetical protein
MDCAICFEAIEKATTGQATLSCGHNFHIRCVVQWFYSQEGASSCPFCRHEVGEKEDLPTAEDMGQEEESEDESEYSEEYEEEHPLIRLSHPVFDSILQYNGGRGLTPALWEQVREDHSGYVYTTHVELNLLIAANGGSSQLPDVEWDCLYARFKRSRRQYQNDLQEEYNDQEQPEEQQEQREEAEWSHMLENFRVEVRPDPTFECAKKIQAVWRGFSTRRRFTTQKALPPAWLLSRFLAVI